MTTSGNWSKPKEFVPVAKNTINDIFGTKKGELNIYGYVWEGKKLKSFYDGKQKNTFLMLFKTKILNCIAQGLYIVKKII